MRRERCSRVPPPSFKLNLASLIAESTMPAPLDRTVSETGGSSFRFVWALVRGNLLGRALLMATMALLASLLEVSIPGAIGKLVNSVGQARRSSSMEETAWPFLLLLTAWFVGPLFNRAYGFAKAYMTPRLRHLATLAVTTFIAYRATPLLDELSASVVNKNIEALTKRSIDLVNLMLLHFVRVAVVLVGAGVTIWSSSARYALPFAAYLILFLGMTFGLARVCWGRARNTARSAREATRETAEFVSQIGLIRACNAQQRELETLDIALCGERSADERLHVLLATLRTSQFAISSGFMTIVTWWSVRDATAGELSLVGLTVILSVGIVLTNVITNLGDHLIDLFEDIGGMREALSHLLKLQSVPWNQDVKVQPKVPTGPLSLEFRDVEFGYGGQPPRLKKLNLVIEANERVGIVGRSGAGKTTLLRLASGQLRPHRGSILIGGVDLSELSEETANELIFAIEQQPRVLSRSLLENIKYGRPSASMTAIKSAAHKGRCAELAARAPRGYSMRIGAGGAKLSPGEKQRVAIARAILRNPKILLVDEATSALDARSEAEVLKALDEFYNCRTVVVVAHRLAVMRSMDRIVVLEDGELLEQGSHEHLIRKGGLYAELWRDKT